MRDTMMHRGPDGEGLWISKNGRVGLAHRRLAIIDLSPSAAQPMCNEDGSVWIVYNGEIYNHVELRVELERLGHRFRTDHSDTEVVVHAFEEWGIDCVRRLRGMFAFGLWDGRARELWLARDRIGIKPLYYAVRDARLRFAGHVDWVWVDCFTRFPLDERSYEQLRRHFKICLVSPELQNHPRSMVHSVRDCLREMPIDAVCTDLCSEWREGSW